MSRESASPSRKQDRPGSKARELREEGLLPVSASLRAPGSPAETWRFVLPILAVWLIVSVVKVLMHDAWRDEWRAWMIVRDSRGLADLWERLRFDGHPILWYLLMYPLAALTPDVRAMQLLHVAVAGATVLLILRCSPFTRLQKVLLILGYYLFFEFATISRNYGPGFLCVAAALTLLNRPRPAWVWVGVLLALAAQCSAYGTILALAAGAAIAVHAFLRRAEASAAARRMSGPSPVPFGGSGAPAWPLILGAAILAASVASAAQQMMRAPPIDWWGRMVGVDRAAHSLSAIWLGMVPIPKFVYAWWNTNLLAPVHQEGSWMLCAGLSAGLIVAGAALFWRRWSAMAMFLFGVAGVVGFECWKVPWTGLRHTGHIWLAFVAAAWLAAARDRQTPADIAPVPPPPPQPPPQLPGQESPDAPGEVVEAPRRDWLPIVRRWALVAFFAFHAALGLLASGLDLARPFSSGKAAADFLREKHLDRLPMVGHSATVASVISGYLNKPIFYPAFMRWGTYNSQDANQERPWGGAVIVPSTVALIAENPGVLALPADLRHDLAPVLRVSPRPPQAVLILGGWQALPRPQMRFAVPAMDGRKLYVEFTLLASFEKTVAPDETYYLYLVRPAPP